MSATPHDHLHHHAPGGPDHGPGGHAHDHAHPALDANTDRRRLAIALGLILAYMAGEVVAGILSHSLALLADAGHMLTDAAAIGLSLVALRLAERPPEGRLTFGFKRAEILSAQLNGATLFAIALLVVWEAVDRLLHPPEVHALPMLVVAVVGIGVNVLATWQLAKASRQSLNVEGSFQHILTDLYAFIGTAIAAGIILLTGFNAADPLVSLVVAGLMLRSGYRLLRDSGRVLLEAAPAGLEVEAIGTASVEVPGVAEVHDLHVWEITSGFPALTAHVLVSPEADCHAVRQAVAQMLHERFGIDHTTLQVDHRAADELHQIGGSVCGAQAGGTGHRH